MVHNPVTAKQIITLLERRHTKDVFVAECKDGPSMYGSHSRLDAWALRRSYTQPCMSGYEIKVRRADFMGDDKWQSYLPMCNELWWVTPWGLVEPAEVPGDCGLLWATRTGTQLRLKKKAAHREIETPIDVLLYVLISRASISRTDLDMTRDNAEHWAELVQNEEKALRNGHAASHIISRKVSQRCGELERENARCKALADGAADLVKAAEKMGINVLECKGWGARYAVQDALARHGMAPTRGFLSNLRGLLEDLEKMSKETDNDN